METICPMRNSDVLVNSSNLCRICLLDKSTMVHIFDPKEVISLSSKAMRIADIKMDPDDGLPNQFCYNCASKVDEYYNFKLQIERAEKVLRKKFQLPSGITSVKQLTKIESTMKEHNYVAENVDIEKIKRPGNITTLKTIPESSSAQMHMNNTKISSELNHEVDEENYFENLNLSSRLKQLKSTHIPENYYLCYLCDKIFLTKEILKEHMHSHEEVKQGFLKNSLRNVESKKSQKMNTEKCVASEKNKNKCPYCGKQYSYITSLSKHIEQHKLEAELSSEETLMPLEVSFHEEDDSLDLDYSGVVNNENLSNNHTIINNQKDEPNSSIKENPQMNKLLKINEIIKSDCNSDQLNMPSNKITRLCNNNFKVLLQKRIKVLLRRKSSIRRSKMRLKKQLFMCKICRRGFTSQIGYKKHIENHNKIRRFKCFQCNKTFVNKLQLENHRIITSHNNKAKSKDLTPNRTSRRVAAKAAQKIIEQIKTEMDTEDSDLDTSPSKINKKIPEDDDYNANNDLHKSRSKNFECNTCYTKCLSKQNLINHMKIHTQNIIEKTQLNYVKQEYHSNDDKNNTDNDDDFNDSFDWPLNTYKCHICHKKYNTKKSLHRHQLLHKEPNYECEICNIKFHRKDKLKVHYDKCSQKNPNQVRKCTLCNDIFESNEKLREHRFKHVDEGILTQEDLKAFEPNFEENTELYQTGRKRRCDITGLECPECHKKYKSRSGLLSHLRVHEKKVYHCDICSKKFYRKEILKIHIVRHNIVKPYKCPKCVRSFMKEDQLNDHLGKHEEKIKRKKSKESDGSKRFLCEICSKCFTQSTTLIAHLRAHKGIKPYICNICSRPFTTNAYLKLHMRTHTQERPYICQYCSRAFARSDTLSNHLTSHTGEAKYHCKFCPKNFRRLKSLKEHVFTHTGQRPYGCPTCDKTFNNNGSRYSHSKRCKQNSSKPPKHFVTEDSTYFASQEEKEDQCSEEVLPDRDFNSLTNQHPQLQIQDPLGDLNPELRPAIIAQNTSMKPPDIKTVTISRPLNQLLQSQSNSQHEMLMPLILPLNVTLSDVGEEVILPHCTKMFTT